MYRQSHSSFGRASYRVNSVPENYSGNAFRKDTSNQTEDNPEIKDEKEFVSPNIDNPPAKKENIRREAENREPKEEKNDLLSLLSPQKLNIASDTALLFLVLLVLAAGDGERDDGAIFMILILLML